jgi:hypothetical protein
LGGFQTVLLADHCREIMPEPIRAPSRDEYHVIARRILARHFGRLRRLNTRLRISLFAALMNCLRVTVSTEAVTL